MNDTVFIIILTTLISSKLRSNEIKTSFFWKIFVFKLSCIYVINIPLIFFFTDSFSLALFWNDRNINFIRQGNFQTRNIPDLMEFYWWYWKQHNKMWYMTRNLKTEGLLHYKNSYPLFLLGPSRIYLVIHSVKQVILHRLKILQRKEICNRDFVLKYFLHKPAILFHF